ncbi:hypothetical protein MIND_00204900 [Mycena indigotica]|uniref:Uncharacterized protein n=1 Tax=Mycena indigotica TaxID=2126181 RepID=A0A8H6T9Q9_9AGAR|nr:uncharacterized protein MIND_00204900 [Mycena indigotica]KAF7311935.1 hypothetical protein MIND_00204900 [Mycena indigotica]
MAPSSTLVAAAQNAVTRALSLRPGGTLPPFPPLSPAFWAACPHPALLARLGAAATQRLARDLLADLAVFAPRVEHTVMVQTLVSATTLAHVLGAAGHWHARLHPWAADVAAPARDVQMDWAVFVGAHLVCDAHSGYARLRPYFDNALRAPAAAGVRAVRDVLGPKRQRKPRAKATTVFEFPDDHPSPPLDLVSAPTASPPSSPVLSDEEEEEESLNRKIAELEELYINYHLCEAPPQQTDDAMDVDVDERVPLEDLSNDWGLAERAPAIETPWHHDIFGDKRKPAVLPTPSRSPGAGKGKENKKPSPSPSPILRTGRRAWATGRSRPLHYMHVQPASSPSPPSSPASSKNGNAEYDYDVSSPPSSPASNENGNSDYDVSSPLSSPTLNKNRNANANAIALVDTAPPPPPTLSITRVYAPLPRRGQDDLAQYVVGGHDAAQVQSGVAPAAAAGTRREQECVEQYVVLAGWVSGEVDGA